MLRARPRPRAPPGRAHARAARRDEPRLHPGRARAARTRWPKRASWSAEAYDAFTEGFATPDLRAARELLERLGEAPPHHNGIDVASRERV